jgi:hypothetical protein
MEYALDIPLRSWRIRNPEVRSPKPEGLAAGGAPKRFFETLKSWRRLLGDPPQSAKYSAKTMVRFGGSRSIIRRLRHDP